MRLLYTTSDGNFRFTKDIIRAEEIPPYAILSHTWGDQEVVFDDVRTYDAKEIETEKQGGWEKIRFCARQAKLNGLEHFWVDTCCIDKTNNTELSEAINSMFRWYQNSHKCYVYLPDVQSKSSAEDSRPSSEWKAAFRASRWFTRGWTLQELVAPGSVEFFSADGARLGDKDSLKQTIHEVTGIPIEALSSSDMSKFDVSERFTWAEHRQTTREEDGAYCLLGIVGCYLPLIYGEGKKNALNRLRKEMQGREEKLSQIRSWLSAPDPAMNYLKAHKQRQAGTGLWLLQNENFREWKENAASRLWLYGIPGCGKTILSSTVVEHLQHHCGDDKRKVTVYFYFDFNDAQKQIPELMLRSLLRQLLQHTVTIPRCVDELFSSCGDGQQQPPLHKLLTVIPEVMRQFSHVYVVLDALDESAKRAELMEMLATVAGWQLDVSHLLMTSRKERDIEMCLDTFVVEDNMICLQRDVVDEDILRFVQQKLCDDKRLAKWNKNAEVRQEIKTALMRGAQGMFRWATCQLDVIAECRNLSMLRKSLATLPQTLDQTYDRILTAISEKDRMYTIRILQWLTFSARPLSLEEVAEVVAIDVARKPAFDRDEVLADPLEALEICSSLVTTVKEEPTWRSEHGRQIVILAHYSVQEYLVSERIMKGPAKQYSMKEIECHKAMTIGCLGYLNQFQEPLSDEIYYASALANYSAQFWSDHFQKIGDGEDEISRLAVRLLLTDKHVFANLFRIYDPETGESYEVHDSDYPCPPPFYYISALGLNKLVKVLLDQGVDVNAEGGLNGSALFAAVSQGHLAVVELLVNAKADVDIQVYDGEYPLDEALRNGNEAIVKVLIHAGADVNMANKERLYPIQSASELGDKTLVKVLIDAGADVNGRHGTDDDALLIALHGSNKAIATLLIDAGADANSRDENDCTALQIASKRGYIEVVKSLLDAGADINAEGVTGDTALHFAFKYTRETTAMLLLERGANVGLDSRLKGALHYLVNNRQCTPSLVNALRQYGAPLDTVDVDNMTPLHYCVKSQHEAVAKQLIDAGVPIDSKVRRQAWPRRVVKSRDSPVDTTFAVSTPAAGLTPLHFAALKAKLSMTKFLLEHGADPNALSEHGETPLHLALRATIIGTKFGDCWDIASSGFTSERETVLNALLADRRTSLTAPDDDVESHLRCLGYGKLGSALLVQTLISRGAGPGLIISIHQNPLHLAIQAGHTKTVKALLFMGVKLPPANEDGTNTLHYAIQLKNYNIVDALIESEQVRAVGLTSSKDKNGRNLLHHVFLANWDSLGTVQLLLDRGTSGSQADNMGISPLAQYFKCSRLILRPEMCQRLLAREEVAFFVSQEGQTLGHLCAERFDFDVPILKVLNEGGVDLMRKDCGGRTILHHSVLYNTLTEWVLEHLLNVIGIKADEQDAQGRTALQYAIEKADPHCNRDPWAFKRWERTVSMLSDLKERKGSPYLSKQTLQPTFPTPLFHSPQIETECNSSALALACPPYFAHCSNLESLSAQSSIL